MRNRKFPVVKVYDSVLLGGIGLCYGEALFAVAQNGGAVDILVQQENHIAKKMLPVLAPTWRQWEHKYLHRFSRFYIRDKNIAGGVAEIETAFRNLS